MSTILDALEKSIERLQQLEWRSVETNPPTEEDAVDGDVEWFNEHFKVWEDSFDNPGQATHWRPITYPL